MRLVVDLAAGAQHGEFAGGMAVVVLGVEVG